MERRELEKYYGKCIGCGSHVAGELGVDTEIMSNVLLIEPFYSGSHKALIDLLYEELHKREDVKVHLETLPGKKWHWRARTSALYFAQSIPKQSNYSCVFASCVLPLHELLGLRPDLQGARKVIYFHENQLVYPVRKSKDRDFQYGYNQIMSCLAADKIIFNSDFNKESFLSSIKSFFKLQPDFRPKDLREVIEPKCHTLYFPMDFDRCSSSIDGNDRGNSSGQVKNSSGIVRIVWPHRWEFDKNPDLFFKVLYRLVEGGHTNFRLSVLGESYTDNPPVFAEAQSKLEKFIDHFGHLPSKSDYFQALKYSDVVVSTADHEFFGVAMLEASFVGCYPLCPDKLVYPEIFKNSSNRFKDEDALYKKLKGILSNVTAFKYSKDAFQREMDYDLYDWNMLKTSYFHLLCE